MTPFRWPRWMLGVALLLAAGCTDSIGPGTTEPAERRVRAEIATAERVLRASVFEVPGTVVSRAPVTVAAQLMGTVLAVAVREGERVAAGQEMAVLDQRQVAARLAQARAELARAEAEAQSAVSALDGARAAADLAAGTHARYRGMQAEETVSLQEFAEVEARFRQAEAGRARAEAQAASARRQVEAARAMLAEAQAVFGDSRILAPCAGVVSARLVEPGDLARPGVPLFRLETPARLEVEAAIPEGRMEAIAPGLHLEVRVPALGERVFSAPVATVVPAADPASRSVRVKLALPEDPELKPGLFARVAIPGAAAPMLLIPRRAVIPEGQLTGLFQLDDEGRARFRLVRLGADAGEQVEVLTGLAPGTRYVAGPAPGLADGVRVETLP
jgi:multidrug efflux pump subunit AcrA (membrane-fusion protein)